MFRIDEHKLPERFDDRRNYPYRSRDLFHEANRLYGAADVVALHDPIEAKKLKERALATYEQARKLQKDHADKASKWTKMKPVALKLLFGLIATAEIVSIPVLIATMYVMCKQKPSAS